MRWFALSLILLASPAYGQIVAPAEVEQGKLIVASISVEIPEKAQLKGPGWIVPEGLDFLEVAPGKIVATGMPGTYTLRYERSWLHIEPVTFTDGAGNTVTIQSFLGMGDYKETVTVTVKGGAAPGPGPVPPPPPGQRWALILEESSQPTPAQRNLFLKLRQEFQSSRLLILDKDQVPPGYSKIAQQALAANITLPLLAVVSESGELVRVVKLPSTVDEVKQEIAK